MAQIQKKDLKPALLKNMNKKGDEKAPTLKDLAAMLGDAIFQMIKPEDPIDLIPGGKIVQVAKAVLGSSEGEAAIRRGGRSDLYALHGAYASRLNDLLLEAEQRGVTPQMHLMSYAVAKNPNNPIFGDMHLIPKPDVVDPVNSRNIELRNRDFYTATYEPNQDLVQNYVESKRGRFVQAIPRTDQALSIEMSPRFKSFKDYEENPLGAALLDKKVKPIDNLAYKLRDLGLLARGSGYGDGDPAKTLQNIHQRLLKGLDDPNRNDTWLEAVLKRVETQGSEYAEGKVNKPLALTDKNFVAAILPKSGLADVRDLQKMLENKGIATGSFTDFLGPDDLRPIKSYAEKKTEELKAIAEKGIRDTASFMDTALLDWPTLDRFKASIAQETGNKYTEPFIGYSIGKGELEAYLNSAHDEIAKFMLYSPAFQGEGKAIKNILDTYWAE